MLKKKVECIMLDTTDTNPVNVPFLKLVQKTNQGERLKNHIAGGEFRRYLSYGCIPQHLYFVDDSHIKSGDYFIMNGCILRQCKSTNNEPFTIPTIIDTIEGIHHVSVCKKVISTTDKSLKIEKCSGFIGKEYYLPQPSDSFIASYIKAFNEGKKIEFVNVDYEEYCADISCGKDTCYLTNKCENLSYKPKVDKNNTITITRCKENYSAEEVNKILDSFAERFVANTDMAYKQKDIADWKTQNL